MGLLFQRFAQSSVRGKVQGGGTVVQNQYLGVRHQRAGNGQTLALAAAEIAPGGLHRFIQPFGLAAHKVRRLGNLQGLPDLLIGGIGAGPLHVVPDGAGKQHGALRHNADHLAQLGKTVLLHGMAKQINAAAGAVIKAGNQVDQGGFAAARAADHADGLAVLGGKADVRQAGGTGTVVGKAHMVKCNGRGARCRGKGGRGGVGHRGFGVQNLRNTDAAGQCAGDRNHQIGNAQQVDKDLVHIVN